MFSEIVIGDYLIVMGDFLSQRNVINYDLKGRRNAVHSWAPYPLDGAAFHVDQGRERILVVAGSRCSYYCCSTNLWEPGPHQEVVEFAPLLEGGENWE